MTYRREDSSDEPEWRLPIPDPLRSKEDNLTDHYELGEKLGRYGAK
jgi:hypothetical protein